MTADLPVCRLRRWRHERGLQQADLARAAGVSVSTISCIECGYSRGSERVYQALAKALGIEPGQIAEYQRLVERRRSRNTRDG